MKLLEFVEKVLSNDVITIVDDVVHGKAIHDPTAAYCFLLEDGKRPAWADEVLDKEIERFTYGKMPEPYPHTQLCTIKRLRKGEVPAPLFFFCEKIGFAKKRIMKTRNR